MSQHATEIDFRGAKREVEFDYEGDGIIVWWFIDEGVCSGANTTEAEQAEVYQKLWDYLEDLWAPRPEDDL